jgi:hypothetical protein
MTFAVTPSSSRRSSLLSFSSSVRTKKHNLFSVLSWPRVRFVKGVSRSNEFTEHLLMPQKNDKVTRDEENDPP